MGGKTDAGIHHKVNVFFLYNTSAFDVSETYTKPVGLDFIILEMVGGGGGGEGASGNGGNGNSSTTDMTFTGASGGTGGAAGVSGSGGAGWFGDYGGTYYINRNAPPSRGQYGGINCALQHFGVGGDGSSGKAGGGAGGVTYLKIMAADIPSTFTYLAGKGGAAGAGGGFVGAGGAVKITEYVK